MTDLPDPLVPAEVDLRDFAFMPLDVLRLRDSDLSCVGDAEIFRVAVLSWCVAWHQVPAASLPDDDTILARLLGYGRDVQGWSCLRESGGLRGWVLCSDGRMYHPVVAAKALDAWGAKTAQRERTKAARESRHGGYRAPLSAPPLRKTSRAQTAITIPVADFAEKKPAPEPAVKANGSRLPEDWTLPDDWLTWALGAQPGWSAARVREVADQFRDYWCGKAGQLARKVDWLATWRNWVRRTATDPRSPQLVRKFDPVAHVNARGASEHSSGRVWTMAPDDRAGEITHDGGTYD